MMRKDHHLLLSPTREALDEKVLYYYYSLHMINDESMMMTTLPNVMQVSLNQIKGQRSVPIRLPTSQIFHISPPDLPVGNPLDDSSKGNRGAVVHPVY